MDTNDRRDDERESSSGPERMPETEGDFTGEKDEAGRTAGDTEEKRKVIRTGLIILSVLVVAFVLYFFVFNKKSPLSAAGGKNVGQTSASAKSDLRTDEGKPAPATPPVELGRSDDWVRQLIRQISTHPKLASWLQTPNLIRKFTAAADSIANGASPRAQADFFQYKDDFKVVRKGNVIVPDRSSYNRYNALVDVFVSLDPKSCASLFRALEPLFQEANKELGYPDQKFEDTLVRAVIELLRTPVVEGEIPLQRDVVTWKMLDPRLEGLSEAQKHLLRMGPENVGAVQQKLRLIALALGVPDYRLPKTQFYTPMAGK